MARSNLYVTDYILKGRGNARTGRELAALLHCAPREITAGIERARRAGAPIIASCDSENPGYYLAETADEINSYCRSLNRRAGEIHKTRRALLDAAAALPGGASDFES